MSVLVDTSVLVDLLRGREEALLQFERELAAGVVHASEITRLEVLAGMRPSEDRATRQLCSALRWHPVDEAVAEAAGELGRQWLRSHSSIDAADLAIAATAVLLDARLMTRNVRHFPMFADLTSPY